jgi:hypothetical protein
MTKRPDPKRLSSIVHRQLGQEALWAAGRVYEPVTAAQVREVVDRIAAGHWRDGDPGTLAVFDSGYDLTRLASLRLTDLGPGVSGRWCERS